MAADVIDLILQDHREIERLFDQLDRHPARRPLLVPILSALLIAHDRAEEEEIYPVAREAGGTDEITRSQKEHLRAEDLLVKLELADAEDSAFDTVLTELADMVTAHFREEERQVLPAMRERLGEGQMEALAKAFLSSRDKHFGERPRDRRLSDLQQQARNAGLVGFSDLAKNELADLLRKLAGS
jgi:hemerythrin superfamily protein